MNWIRLLIRNSLLTFQALEITRSEAFTLLICLDVTTFVLLSVFTLMEKICLKNLGKTTAQECKKATSG